MIEFLLNESLVQLDANTENAICAELTVLDWLRLQQRLTGTKEGCGSGDCGACTVVLVSASDTPTGLPLQYTPANACILMMGALQGRQLITVEHLGSSTNLHPVQTAMVKHHGSQCGFCTPGFVMSLFALFHQGFDAYNDPAQQHALIEQYLGGNLCRCTGYAPIIAAAMDVLQQRFGDQHNSLDPQPNKAHIKHRLTDAFDAAESKTAMTLKRINSEHSSAAVSASGYEPSIHVPKTLTDALTLWSSLPDAEIIAGGTDKGLEVTQQLQAWNSIIHIKDVEELNTIEHTPGELIVGASVSIAALLETLTLDFPDAIAMLLRFASEQVRSQATVGGNLGTASPIGDLPPLLLALDAQIDLVSLRGESGTPHNSINIRTLPLSDYFLDYRKTARRDDEWIHSVRIPLPKEGDVLRVYKVSKRMDDDISTVCAAIWMNLEEAPSSNSSSNTIMSARLAYGGMAAIPKRAAAAEEQLIQSVLNEATITRATDALESDFQPIDDARASAAYRQHIAGSLLKRLLVELNGSHTPTDISKISADMSLSTSSEIGS